MNNNILSFERDGKFYNLRGKKMLQSGKLIEAVSNFRIALEREPLNNDFSIDLADCLSTIGRFKESNDVVFDSIIKGSMDTTVDDAIYLLSVNMMSMGEYGMAKVFCNRYMTYFPEGQFVDEIAEMTEVINEFESNINILETTEHADLRKRMNDAGYLLYAGNFNEAISEYESLLKKDPKNSNILNNLALSYYCVGKRRKALELSRKILKTNGNDIHALCNILMITKNEKDIESKQKIKNKLKSMNIIAHDELQKVMFTMAEINEDEIAHKYAMQLLRTKPFDPKLLHCYAASCLNQKMYDRAEESWQKIVNTDPYDLVALYYLGMVKQIKSGTKVFKKISYTYQLPVDEVLSTLKEFNETLLLTDKKDLKERWNNDKKLYIILRWGLSIPDMVIKESALYFLANIGGEKAEELLRAVVTDPEQPDEFKRHVLLIMKDIGAKNPFMVHLNGMMMETLDENNEILTEAPEIFLEALRISMTKMMGRYTNYEKTLFSIWEKLLNNESLLRVRNVNALAALLEYIYVLEIDSEPKIRRIAEIYDAVTDTLKRYIKLNLEWMKNNETD